MILSELTLFLPLSVMDFGLEQTEVLMGDDEDIDSLREGGVGVKRARAPNGQSEVFSTKGTKELLKQLGIGFLMMEILCIRRMK